MPDERMRLMALVRSESRVGHAEHDTRPYKLFTGDSEWFLENISCQYACPAYTDVARYIAHIAAEDYDEAYRINLEDNVVPGILGRVCARPCELACRRGRVDKPIAICWLKRTASDNRSEQHPWTRPARTKSQTVAVVGGGPTGVAAARDLAKLGYGVTIYEALPVVGGMLTTGIPEWRLPRDLCDEEINQYMATLGVEIKVNTPIGRTITPELIEPGKVNAVSLTDLKARHDVVFLACGTQSPQQMEVPGEDYEHVAGLYTGLHFMERINLHKYPQVGKRVAVIGGGFTAMDCSRSSLRMGAERVYVIYRRSRNEMAVYDEEAREAEIEGIEFRFLVSQTEVLISDGKVVGLRCIRNRLGEPDASGRRAPVPIPGTEFILDVDTVVAATGQNSDVGYLADAGVKVTRRRRPEVDSVTWMTSVPGIFAGGDYTAGARNIISAIADGHKAAIAMDQWLRGVKPEDEKVTLRAEFALVPYQDYVSDYHLDVTRSLETWAQSQTLRQEYPQDAAVRMSWQPISIWTADTMQRRLVDGDDYDAVPRQEMPMLPLERRWNLTTEVELGFTHDEAFEEAKRCLQCQLNIFVDGDNCILCNACVEVCPVNVIHMADLELIDSINNTPFEPRLMEAKGWRSGAAMIMDENLCIRCGLCSQICPTNCITMQHFEPHLVAAPNDHAISAVESLDVGLRAAIANAV
jgi:NADPH-dependent glutamate synthase beta subunit-like oxidoreductase/ferredoxin